MIYDSLNNIARYSVLGERFEKGLQWLAEADKPALGRHELEGSDLFVNVQSYDPAPAEDKVFEAHGDYADIQCVLAGEEICQLAAEGKETTPYDPETDAAFYAGEATETCTLTPGWFVIYFPGERHKPGIDAGKGGVYKAVVKIRMK